MLTKLIPLMYLVLVINSWAVAITYVGHAPAWLTIAVPGFLTTTCIVRLIVW